MDQWLFTLLTVLITGFFTLVAALGAQSRAAKQADRHRKDDLQHAQDKADIRAITAFLRSIQSLQDEGQHNSFAENKREIEEGELRDRVYEALDIRIKYLNSLLMETESLYLNSQNEKIATHVGMIFKLLSNHFTAVAEQYPDVNQNLDASCLHSKRTMILLGFEEKLRPHLRNLRSDLVAIAKLELSSSRENSEPTRGMFT